MTIRKKTPGRPRKSGAPDSAARMRASRERKRRAGYVLQQRWVSAQLAQSSAVYSDHQRFDARSLAMHCLIAKKILAAPSRVSQARETLARWQAQVEGAEPSYFKEWDRILKRSPSEIAGFISSMCEDAIRLRQSSPFTKLITAEERTRIYEAFR